MANEGGTSAERTISFMMRLVVALVIPVWGLVMLVLGLRAGAGWWITSGAVVLVIGAVLFCGSSLMGAFIPAGRKFG